MDYSAEGDKTYDELRHYAETWHGELSKLLGPYIELTDQYGKLICQLTLVLGQVPPSSRQDRVIRDLMADVFDFLYEARALILKGKLDVAYPLARRVYESLSLMVACYLDDGLAAKWDSGKHIGNSEVRKILGKHPAGESEELTRELYQFFSLAAHPNRDLVAHRYLGEGNEFVLGSIGHPDLALLADYGMKTVDLWFWFGAFISFAYIKVLVERDPGYKKRYDEAAKAASEVKAGLAEQYNRLLPQYQSEDKAKD